MGRTRNSFFLIKLVDYGPTAIAFHQRTSTEQGDIGYAKLSVGNLFESLKRHGRARISRSETSTKYVELVSMPYLTDRQIRKWPGYLQLDGPTYLLLFLQSSSRH